MPAGHTEKWDDWHTKNFVGATLKAPLDFKQIPPVEHTKNDTHVGYHTHVTRVRCCCSEFDDRMLFE